MRAVITFESIYGNTRAIAEAVAEGLRPRVGDVAVVSHHEPEPASAGGRGPGGGRRADAHARPAHLAQPQDGGPGRMKRRASSSIPAPPRDPGFAAWLSDAVRRRTLRRRIRHARRRTPGPYRIGRSGHREAPAQVRFRTGRRARELLGRGRRGPAGGWRTGACPRVGERHRRASARTPRQTYEGASPEMTREAAVTSFRPSNMRAFRCHAPGLISCPSDSSMRDVARIMTTNHVHAVVVRGVADGGAGAS